LFVDELHLNATGAELFTTMLAERLVEEGYAGGRPTPQKGSVASRISSEVNQAPAGLVSRAEARPLAPQRHRADRRDR
jgi:hypothetical protein